VASVRTLQRQFCWVWASLTLACGGAEVPSPTATEPTPPPPKPTAGRIVALSPDTMSADPGWEVAIAPTVRVTDSSGSLPVPGVSVGFTITAGHGSIRNALAVTDSDGVATVGSWQPGDTATADTLVATAPGLGSVVFSARVLSRRVIARFDLQSIDGDSLPVTYPGGETLVGGRYILFDDGSATLGYDLGTGVYSAYPLAYTISGQIDGRARILFILPGPMSPFYAQHGGLFSTGDCVNGTMSMTYTDFIDFDSEVYVLSK